MDVSEFYGLLKIDFPYTTTSKQNIALQLLAKFVLGNEKTRFFCLRDMPEPERQPPLEL